MGNKRRLDPFLEVGDRILETRLFSPGLGGHFGVVYKNELADFGELVFVFIESRGHLDQWSQVAVLAAQSGHPLGVLYRPGIGKLALDLAGAVKRVGEAISETQPSVVAAGAAAGVLVAYF
jgi:hypothetical protein